MEDENRVAVGSGSDLPQTGAVPDVNSPLGLKENTGKATTDPVSTAGVERPSMGPRAGAPAPAGTSGNPAQSTVCAKSVSGQSDNRTIKPVVKIEGIVEIGRNCDTMLVPWKPPFEVERGSESSIQEIIERSKLLRAPVYATPAPTGGALYGTTDELIRRLQKEIAAQAFLSEETSALLSFWALSSWFADGLPIAPGLVITGPAFEGDLVLRTLRSFCRYPLMLTRADTSSLQTLIWHTTPTLLFFDPNISKQMAMTLGCSTSRGYMVASADGYRDFYGPKAIYLGEEAPLDRTPHCSIHVHLHPATRAVSKIASPLREPTVQDLQNQLLGYRLKNLVKVYNSNFEASTLTSDTGAIASALGACIVDSPQLQSELISLLSPVADQQKADRSTCLEAITLEAILNLTHAGKAQILVAEVATEVNRLAHARGERLDYRAETIGHRLKKVGLYTRRLGKAGKGLVMELD